jgi:uncharacterized protein
MAGVSVPVAPTDLRVQVGRHGPVAYLVTVSRETARPHVVSVAVTWDGDALVAGAGSTTAANVGDGADVSLVWPPPPGDAYSLIVDGPAELVDGAGGRTVSVRPTGAVLHRMAGVAGDGPGCVAVTTSPPEQEEPVAEHPNAVTVRRFLNAWFDGDFATWTSLASDDIVIHMRGKPALDGSYRGEAGVMAFFERFAAVQVDGFEMQVEEVLADDRFALAMMRSVYQRAGQTLELRNACAYRIDAQGHITEAWNVSDSQLLEAEFFTLPDLGVGMAAPE